MWIRRTDEGTGTGINTRRVLFNTLGRHSPKLIRPAKNLGISTTHVY